MKYGKAAYAIKQAFFPTGNFLLPASGMSFDPNYAVDAGFIILR